MHQSAQHPAGNPTLSADAEPWHQAETIFSAQYDIIESVQGLSAIVPGHLDSHPAYGKHKGVT